MMRLLQRTWVTHGVAVAIALASAALSLAAATRTSTTFDEIAATAGGARAVAAGTLDMMPDYPPVTQYLYGLPIHLSGINYPAEADGGPPNRYLYAQQLFWGSGNDGQRIILIARSLAALCVFGLVLLTYAFTARYFGAGAGLLASVLIAFTPDILAHGGVAYNDIVLAPAFLASLWALDRTVRRPTLARGVAAGALVSLALGIKHSALVLGPIAILLILVEAAVRLKSDSDTPDSAMNLWVRRLGVAVLGSMAVGYMLHVILYGGDFTLAFLRSSTAAVSQHIAGGNGAPAYLLGRLDSEAPWYFYPVAFLFKTPAALHVLMLLAIAGAVPAIRRTGWRDLLGSRLRAVWLALIVFGVVLIRADLVIGVRYAMPLLAPVVIVTAVGCTLLWQRSELPVRGLLGLLVFWAAASSVSFYPHFLAYTSEYNSSRDAGHEVFVDSSLDWGQGLLELRDFMRQEGIPSIYLSYFGSALPAGYGIDYVPLPSFFPLPPSGSMASSPEPPRFVAISATNLVGTYLLGDPFAAFRQRQPYRVLAHTIFIFEVME